jgi:hypothetical protein
MRWLWNCALPRICGLELTSEETGDAASLLRSVVERFTEGHGLPDLRDAS